MEEWGRRMRLLIAFATVEGQTGKIARFIAEEARRSGHDVSVVEVSDGGEIPSIARYDRVVLAASVHERRHPKSFEVLLAGQKKALADKTSLLVSVSLKAAFEDGLEEAQDYVDELKLRTGFEPDRELLVAGAVKTGSYDYFQSQVVRHVLLGRHGHAPVEGEQEFTNWQELAAATRSFIEG